MADLLLELFSEEIPARMQLDALTHLSKALDSKLAECGIKAAGTSFVTPRRVSVWLKDLPKEQAASETEIKGPKVGAPEQAVAGFCKKNNLTPDQLIERDGVYFAILKKEAQSTAALLKPIIEDILANFPWPKSMRWGSGDIAWVRPLHSILCLFDGEVIPVEFTGIKASNTTRGHRFLSPDVITIKNAADYESLLEKAHVIADRDKRKASIREQAEAAAKAQGLVLKDDIGLLEEVTGLVEYPVVLVGSIDANYMDLPQEVLVLEMRNHQKYFALYSSPVRGEAGRGASGNDVASQSPHPNPPPYGERKLAPHFLITSNITTSDNGKAIIAGNERVLRARLADGRFFWDQDRKKPLAEMASDLAAVTYHAKLGSVADKVARISKLADTLAEAVKADKKEVAQAANLCKADLVSGMVGEFPELQGVMGRYYAKHEGLPNAVAEAIAEHYKPQGPSDEVPSAPVSICVALADKLDTLISMFAIDEKPTGSKDPFALRRAALGVIRIILENNLRLSLLSVMPAKAGIQSNNSLDPGLRRDDNGLLAFFHDRLAVQLKDAGISHDVIKAATASGDDDLVRIVARAKAVSEFLGSDDGTNMLAAYKRAANILAIEEKKDKTRYTRNDFNEDLLKEPAERALRFSYTPQQNEELRGYLENEEYTSYMKWLASLRTPMDAFFEHILVNCDDPALRKNRLSLLAMLKETMDNVADFGQIEG